MSAPRTVVKRSVGSLQDARIKDAHHVIQDAVVRDLPGYNYYEAPGIQLPGPSNVRGTPHYSDAGGGTYAAERRIGYKALRRACISPADARQAIEEADSYFYGLGVRPDSPTRTPGTDEKAPMSVKNLESVAVDLVTKLAHGEYEEVVAACSVTRLSADDLREVISEYGKTFIAPPTGRYEGFDAFCLRSFDSPSWSVRAPLWSEEEGRSDLELQLTIHQKGERLAIELDDLHVP